MFFLSFLFFSGAAAAPAQNVPRPSGRRAAEKQKQ
jgi:hypothetical protein